ncbi:preprotein translocase subunit SecA [Croceimicrobium hydrocarbonivorans]|uniref:Protein translocase subunit SecA n=1 Tax=Croceimicrobium hydrocarbonivorans TaxID=2761580 RepID=A0A7H0VJP8_9FLAO|nr:preprotein translocase subunit SecA [Croceimicrobium hydrocarbonivorans]QNR25946.1 preprotein translocase subunit SecA [Croceimicrobium hydrocarbonivorans]
MLGNILAKIFGTKSDRDMKALQPLVDEVNAEFEKLKGISDDELRARTAEFQAKIQEAIQNEEQEIAELREKIEQEEEVEQKEQYYEQIDALNEKITESIESALDGIRAQAFAVVKETARRWKENGELVVSANEHDRQMAAILDGVRIEGDKAIWSSQWKAAGADIHWDMMHYDVQLIGGSVLHKGSIAEMATGEGKTLVSTLPVYLNALPKRGVHVVTVNDYLARRDSEWMGPLYQFHGLSVDCIDRHRPNSEERRKAYQADITYGTNNEFGFDYLRDNMAGSPEDLVQRVHNYAIVDEVDSVLIDEARTPLIISGPTPQGDRQEFNQLKPHVVKLVNAQKALATSELREARSLIASGNKEEKEEGAKKLLRVHRGMPKNKALIKFLSEEGIKTLLQKTENFYMQEQNKNMHLVDDELFFTIDEKSNQIDLTDRGIELISGDTDKDFFILEDISTQLSALEAEGLPADEQAKRKDEIMRDFSIKSERIHTMNQLLKAYTLFEKDNEYVVMDNKVKIVDEQTGRIMDGRRYSDGLHQAIEAKENVKIEAATQTYATVTLQNYFRMYNKLSGMTGTAETEAEELWDIYKLEVTVIPTNRPIIRDDREDLVYRTRREKFNAIIEEISKLVEEGRPVLVGTTNVEISEVLSRALKIRKIPHNVLNAKLHQKESEIVAEAGQPGKVTIATNMAGRGTDIKLTPEAKAAGGLAIIGSERHDSRRVDRQLRGRSGRQGDPGSSQFFVSLEDELMRLFNSERVAKIMDRMGLEEGEVIQHSMVTRSIERAQKKVEENNFGIRKRLLEYDDVMNSQREVIYRRRRHALYGERMQVDIANMFYETVEAVVNETQPTKDFESFKLEMLRVFSMDTPVSQESFEKGTPDELVNSIHEAVMKAYTSKNERIAQMALPIINNVFENQGQQYKNIVIPFTDGAKQMQIVTNLEKAVNSQGRQLIRDFEKSITLGLIDDKWKEHLRDMDDLRQSVVTAQYEQKDPLLIYKFEAFELFRSMVDEMNREIASFLFKGQLPNQDAQQVQQARAPQRSAYDNMQTSHPSADGSSPSGEQPKAAPKRQPVVAEKKFGRNEQVTIQNLSTGEKRDLKYKVAENMVASGQWIVIDS